ncbi:MAG: hypothetical protein ABI614_11080 [Planctomycetota bacterium]
MTFQNEEENEDENAAQRGTKHHRIGEHNYSLIHDGLTFRLWVKTGLGRK